MEGRRVFVVAMLAVVLGAPTACGPEGREPGEVLLPVESASDGVTTATNDLGWEVTLTQARVAVGDLEFTVGGETHAADPVPRVRLPAAVRSLGRLLVSDARAHPGHQAGGEVTGQLPGDFVLDLIGGGALGQGMLLVGDYNGVNLSFRVASSTAGLAAGDPLVGHTAVLAGTARKDGVTVAFQATLDVQDGLQMVGGNFDLAVGTGTQATLALTLNTVDPSENDTLFDGLDFGALDGDGDRQVVIAPGEPAHNVLQKTLIRHDHWGIVVR